MDNATASYLLDLIETQHQDDRTRKEARGAKAEIAELLRGEEGEISRMRERQRAKQQKEAALKQKQREREVSQRERERQAEIHAAPRIVQDKSEPIEKRQVAASRLKDGRQYSALWKMVCVFKDSSDDVAVRSSVAQALGEMGRALQEGSVDGIVGVEASNYVTKIVNALEMVFRLPDCPDELLSATATALVAIWSDEAQLVIECAIHKVGSEAYYAASDALWQSDRSEARSLYYDSTSERLRTSPGSNSIFLQARVGLFKGLSSGSQGFPRSRRGVW